MVNMMKYALAVIVSVTRADAEEQGGSVRVWSRVAKLLTPTLGKLCSRFYPAVSQRGTCLDNKQVLSLLMTAVIEEEE